MNKPLLGVGAFLLAGIGTAGAVYVASSGGEEEIVQQMETATPSGSAFPSPTGTSPPTSGTPSATPAPSATPSVPEGWIQHSQPASKESPPFRFVYPPDLSLQPADLSSEFSGLTIVLTTWDWRTPPGGPAFPAGTMKIDIGVSRTAGLSGCGPEGGTETSLAGGAARESIEIYNPPRDGVSKTLLIAGLHGDFCFVVNGVFTQEGQEDILYRVAQSLTIGD